MIFLDNATLYLIRDSIALIGVVVIAAGALHAIYEFWQMARAGHIDPNYVRLQFGNSVILGLEFMVGADIIGSLIDPDYYSLGLLAIIVIVRTILSYFLSRELEALTPQQRRSLK